VPEKTAKQTRNPSESFCNLDYSQLISQPRLFSRENASSQKPFSQAQSKDQKDSKEPKIAHPTSGLLNKNQVL